MRSLGTIWAFAQTTMGLYRLFSGSDKVSRHWIKPSRMSLNSRKNCYSSPWVSVTEDCEKRNSDLPADFRPTW